MQDFEDSQRLSDDTDTEAASEVGVPGQRSLLGMGCSPAAGGKTPADTAACGRKN